MKEIKEIKNIYICLDTIEDNQVIKKILVEFMDNTKDYFMLSDRYYKNNFKKQDKLYHEFEKEIERQKQEINELKEIYEMMLYEKQQALEKNEELQKMRNCHYSPLLSIDDREKVSYYQKFLLSYLQEKTRNYQSSHEIYRKFDILFSILKANGGHL